MRARDIDAHVAAFKKATGIRKYMPAKYFSGLKTAAQLDARILDILTGNFSTTDAIPVPRRKSTYTTAFEKRYPGARGTAAVAAATGIPRNILRTVHDRGLAAHRTGHRVGATPQQWAHAREKSFALRGCTWHSADHDLAVEATKRMKPANVARWMAEDSCSRKKK